MKQMLDKCVFLDGDWCWDAHPFQVTHETKAMVKENISFLLNQFIRCSAYENVIFCWVMHQQSIINEILSAIDKTDCRVIALSLMCSEAVLRERLAKDIEAGIRTEDVIERSAARITMYQGLSTVKVDTVNKSPEEIAREIISL